MYAPIHTHTHSATDNSSWAVHSNDHPTLHSQPTIPTSLPLLSAPSSLQPSLLLLHSQPSIPTSLSLLSAPSSLQPSLLLLHSQPSIPTSLSLLSAPSSLQPSLLLLHSQPSIPTSLSLLSAPSSLQPSLLLLHSQPSIPTSLSLLSVTSSSYYHEGCHANQAWTPDHEGAATRRALLQPQCSVVEGLGQVDRRVQGWPYPSSRCTDLEVSARRRHSLRRVLLHAYRCCGREHSSSSYQSTHRLWRHRHRRSPHQARHVRWYVSC